MVVFWAFKLSGKRELFIVESKQREGMKKYIVNQKKLNDVPFHDYIRLEVHEKWLISWIMNVFFDTASSDPLFTDIELFA